MKAKLTNDEIASKLWEEYLRVDTWSLQTEEGAHGAKCAIRCVAVALGVYSEFCAKGKDDEKASEDQDGKTV